MEEMVTLFLPFCIFVSYLCREKRGRYEIQADYLLIRNDVGIL
jgi:hypothetical protein